VTKIHGKNQRQKCTTKTLEDASISIPGKKLQHKRSQPKSHGRNLCLGGGNSNSFYVHPLFGEDEPNLTHIFQMGWFNHQPVVEFPEKNHPRFFRLGPGAWLQRGLRRAEEGGWWSFGWQMLGVG